MPRVLLVSGSLPPIRCGVGYYTLRLSREMSAEKIDFNLLSTDGVDNDTPVPLLTIPDWKIRSLRKMLSAIDESRADIVHIEYPAVGYRRQLGVNLLPYTLRLFRHHLKIIITLHEYHQSRWIGRWRNRITVWPAHKVIVSNQSDAEALKSLDKISVIPIGASFDVAPQNPAFFEKIMRSHNLDPKGRTLVFFGYAFPAKRLEVLLDALAESQLKDFQLLIFPELDNDSKYQRQLIAKVSKLNDSRSRIGMNEFLDGPGASAVLQQCDYFVLPSSQALNAKSGTAIAAIENNLIVISLAAKRPQNSLPFVHLKNCYLLNEVTPAAIASAVNQLDRAPSERKRIQIGAQELKQYFSWNNIVKQHLKIYEEL